jgi:hypothetical protein
MWRDGALDRRVEEAAPCHDFPPAYQTQGGATTGDRAGLRRGQPLLTNVRFLRNLLVYVSTYVIRVEAFDQTKHPWRLVKNRDDFLMGAFAKSRMVDPYLFLMSISRTMYHLHT